MITFNQEYFEILKYYLYHNVQVYIQNLPRIVRHKFFYIMPKDVTIALKRFLGIFYSLD